jgi:aspartate kinase
VTSIRALPAIAAELKGMANLRWENHKALVCLVGEKIRRQPEIASQVFRSISDVETRMICQGASERSLSFLVDEARADESVRRLHHLFFPHPTFLQLLSNLRPCVRQVRHGHRLRQLSA